MKAVARCSLSKQLAARRMITICMILSFFMVQEATSYVVAVSSRSRALRAVPESSLEQTSSEASMFQLMEIPGKGFGAIALRDIVPGELIMNEKPLFSITTKKAWFTPSESYSEKRIEDEVEKLSVSDQERFYSLHGFISHENELVEEDLVIDVGSTGAEKAESTVVNSKKLKMRVPSIHIYKTNAYPMGTGISGIFPLISRLNSHCTPNVHYNWDGKSGQSTIYCVSNIKKGDEIVNCYIGLYMRRLDRMKYLWNNFGFPCSCKACSLTGDEQEESDYRRIRLESLEEMTVTAILEKKKNLALDLVNTRLQVLEEEGLLNSATAYKCEYDGFLSVTSVLSSTSALIDDISGSADCGSAKESNGEMLEISNLDSTDRAEAKDWLEKAYNHVVECKGPESTEAHKCFYYLSILNLL